LTLGLLPTVVATIAALYFSKAVLVPLAVAVLLAFLLAPVVTRLERWRLAERDRHTGELDARQETFVRQSLRDLIEELGDAQKADDAAALAALADNAAIPATFAPLGFWKPQVVVLCLPAHDEADELIALMLAQLLELKGLRVFAASQISLAGEMLALVKEHAAGAVCVSALPPGALAHARYLCKRLHVTFLLLPTVVGLWTSKTDAKKSLERLPHDGPVYLVTSAGAAVVQIHQVLQPLLLQRANAEAEAGPHPQASGPVAVTNVR